jgi:DNA-binding transcriptional LysR family regulator
VDQLEAMRIFVAAADAGSLSAAARRLGVPVASVSRKLAALEAHVGARLLSRSTRRMATTEPGRRYLEACRALVAAVEEADRSVADDAVALRGTLAVTAPLVFGRLHVLPAVAEFLRQHPRVDVRLALDDRNVDLIDAGIDVAVRIGALPDSSLVSTRVGSMRRIACASPDYLERRGEPRAPTELAAHDCISFAPLASADRWAFKGRRGLESVAVHTRLAVNGAEAAVDAAVAGLGVARVLHYQAAAALGAGRLRRILERFEPPALPVSMVHGEGRAPRAKVRAFVSLAAPMLRRSLAGSPP